MMITAFCKRCGYLMRTWDKEDICPCCGFKLIDTGLPIKWLYENTQEQEDAYIEEHLDHSISTPEYIQKRIDWRKNYLEENKKSTAEFNRTHPKCPYCHTQNTKKITAASRMLSIGIFGLGSSKVGKQWHCNNCGSDF